jgi:hypothetical protein
VIDNVNWSWKISLVRENFIAPEANTILNTPLRNGGGEDFGAWNLEKTCVYTVKSAYRSLMTRNEQSTLAEGVATESSYSEKQLWMKLWKLQVTPKVRVF